MKPTEHEMMMEDLPWDKPDEIADMILELRQEVERLKNLTASGIHTCSEQCQRPMCVMRRQLRDANAKIAELAAENQGQRDAIAELRKELEKAGAEIERLSMRHGIFDPYDPV